MFNVASSLNVVAIKHCNETTAAFLLSVIIKWDVLRWFVVGGDNNYLFNDKRQHMLDQSRHDLTTLQKVSNDADSLYIKD